MESWPIGCLTVMNKRFPSLYGDSLKSDSNDWSNTTYKGQLDYLNRSFISEMCRMRKKKLTNVKKKNDFNPYPNRQVLWLHHTLSLNWEASLTELQSDVWEKPKNPIMEMFLWRKSDQGKLHISIEDHIKLRSFKLENRYFSQIHLDFRTLRKRTRQCRF